MLYPVRLPKVRATLSTTYAGRRCSSQCWAAWSVVCEVSLSAGSQTACTVAGMCLIPKVKNSAHRRGPSTDETKLNTCGSSSTIPIIWLLKDKQVYYKLARLLPYYVIFICQLIWQNYVATKTYRKCIFYLTFHFPVSSPIILIQQTILQSKKIYKIVLQFKIVFKTLKCV